MDGSLRQERELIEKFLTDADNQRRIDSAGPSELERERMKQRLIALISAYLKKLPIEEYDFLVLYYLSNVPQRSIGNLFNITQRAVSYRISRAVSRLQFLIQVADVDEEEMRADLIQLFNDVESADIVCKVFSVTNLSEVQRQENTTFFHVRSKFYEMIENLKKIDLEEKAEEDYYLAKRIENYVRCLDLVKENFGILNSRLKARRSWAPFYLG